MHSHTCTLTDMQLRASAYTERTHNQTMICFSKPYGDDLDHMLLFLIQQVVSYFNTVVYLTENDVGVNDGEVDGSGMRTRMRCVGFG